MSFRLLITSTFLLVFLTAFIAPAEALAVVQSLNGQTGQTQTFQNDSNVTISSSNNIHTIGWQGYLPISRGGTGVGSFTAGSLLFFNGSTFAENNSKLFWDSANNRLGIGTSSPSSTLEVSGTAKVTSLTSSNDATINSLNIGLGGAGIATSTSIGNGALYSNSATNNNTAVGYAALGRDTNSGEQNTAVGSLALNYNTSGSYNAAFGHRALLLNTSGIRNVAVGGEALNSNDTGSNNVALGFRSMTNNTTGGSSVAIGDLSAAFLTGESGGNVVIGQAAAIHQADGSTALTTAIRSVYIGNIVQGYDNNDVNSIVIGFGAIGAGANKTVIGNSNMTDIYFGSSAGLANIRAKKMFLGSSSTPGCMVMGDSDGSGVTYVTVNDGVMTVSATEPSACQ